MYALCHIAYIGPRYSGPDCNDYFAYFVIDKRTCGQQYHSYRCCVARLFHVPNNMQMSIGFVCVPKWASYQICKIVGCACSGNAGNVSPPPRVCDPDIHHGTCVPWCMPGLLTSGFLWGWWLGKRSRHSRRMRNPQSYVSGRRPVHRANNVIWMLQIHLLHQQPGAYFTNEIC